MLLKFQMNQIDILNLNCVISLLREECEKFKDSELYLKGERVFSRAVQWICYLLGKDYLDLHTYHRNKGNQSLACLKIW